MRLHRLEICGIGPFAGRQVIDFEALNGAGLFLLSGPTGSGKTSVLDAVAIALYGQPPGARQGGQDIVSHHRDLKSRPQVCLEASLGSRRIRVTRSPEHLRPRKRGDGETTERPTALLEVADATGEWVAHSSRIDEVNDSLRDWLGMDREQFAQVVMLPQGQFATFLRSDARERRKLLEQLFPSYDFTFVENWLRDHARQARDVRDAKRAEIEQRLAAAEAVAANGDAHGDAPGGSGEPGDEADGETDELEEESRPTVSAEQIDAWVKQTEGRLAAKMGEAEAAQDEAKRKLDRADRLLRAAEGRQQKIAECERQRQTALADWRRVRADLAAVPGFSGLESLPEEPESGSAEVCRERERRLREEVTELAAFERDRLAQRSTLRQEIAKLESRQAKLEEERAELVKAGEEAPRKIEGLEVELRASEAAAAQIPGADERVEALARQLRAAVERDRLAEQMAAAEQGLRKAWAQVEDQHRRWVDLRHARQKGIAAELAGELEPGAPCPVCGALEHPTPAESGDGTPSKEEEDAAERRLEELRATHEEARRKLAALSSDHHRCDGTAEGKTTAALSQAHAEAEDELSRLTEWAGPCERLARSLENVRRRQETAAERLAEIGRHLAGAEEQLKAARRTVAEISEQEDELRGDDSTVPARRARLERAADLLHEASAAAGRADEAEAGRREAEAIVLEMELEPARLAQRESAEAHEQATSRLATARSGCEGFRREAGRLPGLIAEYEPLAEAADVASGLAALAQGRNPARLQLATYVLAARLEQVIEAANQRLAPMSSGRYRLVYWAGLAGRGAASGLGIRVFDSYTGSERDTASLSGGESFYASLALALGLAEVVQRETGGRRLETLFIDEGFGTLDSDTLDQVMTVLDELRAGGRTVGVVSHVEELKTRIPSRIEVTPSPTGSTLSLIGV